MKISNTIKIHAASEKVFYWLEDPNHAKQWMTSVTASEIIEQTPNMVGTTFREYVEEDGRGLEMHGVVTEFVPNKRFVVHLDSAVNSVDVEFTLEERAGITLLTQNVDMQFKGPAKLLSILSLGSLKKKIAKQSQREFAALKQLCEQDE